MSKWRAVMSGIPQGSLMGPALLNTFVSDMDHETECIQQLGVICRFAMVDLIPLIQVIHDDIKPGWDQHSFLGDTTGHQLGAAPFPTHSLGLAIRTVLNPEKSAPVQAMG
ncbi:hypothetical protein DUI87_18558 [Hirundo rustica rustica]|uniref:Reverse transcriptase domain-containing protein n=1 Tax=Hirundo rustica rustica TaxID=333673 RepID=A0A3M0JWX7_HIRRU|nr:hypothetical protein DUI87_18558 [Hirundo rustica rustica]